MKYYRMTTIGSHARGSNIVNSAGEPVEPVPELPDFSYYFYTDSSDLRPLGDLMSVGFNPFVVSTRAGELLQNFRCPKNTHFFPVTLLESDFENEDEEDSSEIVGEACGILLDWPEEEVITEEDDKLYSSYSPLDCEQGKTPPPVVQRHVIEPYDLYHGIGIGILVSDRVKKAIEDAGLTNFRFLPVTLK